MTIAHSDLFTSRSRVTSIDGPYAKQRFERLQAAAERQYTSPAARLEHHGMLSAEARRAGWSWALIAKGLGISPAAAARLARASLAKRLARSPLY